MVVTIVDHAKLLCVLQSALNKGCFANLIDIVIGSSIDPVITKISKSKIPIGRFYVFVNASLTSSGSKGLVSSIIPTPPEIKEVSTRMCPALKDQLM